MATATDIASAFRTLAEAGGFGLVWLDPNLVVIGSVGPAAANIVVNLPLQSSLIALIGLEDDILALRSFAGRSLELPSVADTSSPNSDTRFSYTFSWNAADERFIVLVHRTKAVSDLEFELSRQNRARLMAEAHTAATSRELQRANADLESFAAIVSHDLKAPLRQIRTLGDQLLQHLQSEDLGDARATSTAIMERSRRMSAMLNDLFAYSSLGRKYEAVDQIDTRARLDQIAEPWRQQGHTIQLRGDWPILSAAVAPFELVFRNLIANAVQHHDGDRARIDLDVRREGLTYVIWLADDGPGIAIQHQDTVFLPFRSLSPSGTPTSTGMGLAMVKRAVESAGGAISLVPTGAVERGATFKIVWPTTMPST